MKKMTIMLAVLITLCTTMNAQKGALKGSGKTVIQTFSVKDFDKIALLDLDGKIQVEAGKPFAISATIDDNLAPLLEANVENGTLTIRLKGNLYNNKYIEETNINVRIALPVVTEIKHRSNGKLMVNGIAGSSFHIKNTGNGSAYINGAVDVLDIVCRDNGSVYAEKMLAKTINVSRSGNGNVYVNDSVKVVAQSEGNGDVIVVSKKREAKAAATLDLL